MGPTSDNTSSTVIVETTKALQPSTAVQSTTDGSDDTTADIPPSYNGKTFIPLIYIHQQPTDNNLLYKAEAQAKCQEIGGALANIYDQTQMNETMSYIRKKATRLHEVYRFHLGMTYDISARQLYLRNGTAISESKFLWRLDNPRLDMAFTQVYLHVNKDPSSDINYLFNYQDSNRQAICEV
uniref:uncharacterized protein LOC120338362 n=1 Tax=Styela clava TaxID=7725 RepID=UPI00193AAD4F|nr:uncharacterized protein LOC120338362 [Styela clava]